MSRTIPENCPLPFGDRVPILHTVHTAYPSHHPKRHLDRFSHFCMGGKCSAVQCIVNGEENPPNCLFPWDFITLPYENRATSIGNMHRKIDTDRACGSGDILADRQTDRHRQTDVLTTYFATVPAGEGNTLYVRALQQSISAQSSIRTIRFDIALPLRSNVH